MTNNSWIGWVGSKQLVFHVLTHYLEYHEEMLAKGTSWRNVERKKGEMKKKRVK